MLENFIKIVEVGPRDGLQNETAAIATDLKVDLVNMLADSGLTHIEVSSFVSPKRIPQLADAAQVFAKIARKTDVIYAALVPNEQGMLLALESEVSEVALFTAVSNSFCEKNINCTIEDSLQRFIPVIKLAEQHGLPVRAYLSCVLGCPYEGFIKPEKAAWVAGRLFEMGCYEISLGDTIGAGTPAQAHKLIEATRKTVPINKLAVHFHDTRGQALANITRCVDLGIRTVDASISGLGGCPYVPGATGNVATEDVIYLLHGMGYETGVDLAKLMNTGQAISQKINHVNNSRVSTAGVPHEYASYPFTR